MREEWERGGGTFSRSKTLVIPLDALHLHSLIEGSCCVQDEGHEHVSKKSRMLQSRAISSQSKLVQLLYAADKRDEAEAQVSFYTWLSINPH